MLRELCLSFFLDSTLIFAFLLCFLCCRDSTLAAFTYEDEDGYDENQQKENNGNNYAY